MMSDSDILKDVRAELKTEPSLSAQRSRITEVESHLTVDPNVYTPA